MGNKYLLCAIDLFSKYAWVAPLKVKRGISIVNAFQKITSERRKPNEIGLDQGGEFYNKLYKRFFKINGIEIYSTYNKGKFVVAEGFIRTLKNKVFKHMTGVSKIVYFDVLDNIVNKYSNSSQLILISEYNEDSNLTKPKFKVGDHVSILKYENIFATEYTQNWSEEVFVVSKIKNTVPWTYVISDLNGEKIAESFYEKELQKISQGKFRIEKVLKREDDKLYVKWKRYNNSFNSWIDKKDLI